MNKTLINYRNGMADKRNGIKMNEDAVKADEEKNPCGYAYIAGYNGTPYMNVEEGGTK